MSKNQNLVAMRTNVVGKVVKLGRTKYIGNFIADTSTPDNALALYRNTHGEAQVLAEDIASQVGDKYRVKVRDNRVDVILQQSTNPFGDFDLNYQVTNLRLPITVRMPTTSHLFNGKIVAESIITLDLYQSATAYIFAENPDVDFIINPMAPIIIYAYSFDSAHSVQLNYPVPGASVMCANYGFQKVKEVIVDDQIGGATMSALDACLDAENVIYHGSDPNAPWGAKALNGVPVN